jgi:hypothetical protein
MKYRLIHKKAGIKSIEVFAEFTYPEKIQDICFVKDYGFFCLGSDCLLQVKQDGYKSILTIDNPMSICCFMDYLYITYEKGVKRIKYSDNFYQTEALTAKEYLLIFDKLTKVGVKQIAIDVNSDGILLAVPSLNKVYYLHKGDVLKEIGSGKPEFSLSSNIELCSLYSPQWSLFYNHGFLVADTGNNCIRYFGDTHKIITGNPLDNVICPTKMLLSAKKDILYYLSKNYLRTVALSDGKDFVSYNGKNIVSFALMHDKAFTLEEINE